MTKVEGVKGLYFKLDRFKKKVYYYRFSVLENGVTTPKMKKLSKSLTLSKKMIPYIDKGLTVKEALNKATSKSLKLNEEVKTISWLWNLYQGSALPLQALQEQKTKKSRFNNQILNYKAENDNFPMGQKDFTKLPYSYFQTYINYLDDENTKGNIKCGRKTQDNIKATLQALYTFAQKEGLYKQFNPLTHVIIKPYDNHKELLLTNDEILSLYEVIRDLSKDDLEDRKKRLFFIFMIHGRRKSEALKIKWTDLNLLNKEYLIKIGNSKSRKTQYLKMTDWLYEEILDLRSQINMEDSENYIFLNPKTQSYYTDLSKKFNSIKKEAQIKSRFTIHEFRHILGTIAVRQLDKKLHVVGEALTHQSDETTKIYVNRTKENSKLIVDDVLSHIGLIPKENNKTEELKETLQKLLHLLD